ncbi:MAG TPA: HDOD domain-containing protein [Azospira sp.]|nr:HDOD domain-containing protein [Azospira sp.]
MRPETHTPTPAEVAPDQVGSLLGNALRDIGIPPCPEILTQIHAEMAKDEPDLKYLDRIICSDVALAAGLIAIANSPFFGFLKRVRSVREALLMLGLRTTSQAIAGLILRKLFPDSPSLNRFWHSSASIARLSAWLAQSSLREIRVQSDDAYTFGLFRDCGIPILLRRLPQYPDVLKQANGEQEKRFTAVEDAHCPTNHAAVGCLLAQGWWLPDEICLAIRHHHDAFPADPVAAKPIPAPSRGLIATVQLAEHLFQHHTGLSQSQEWHKQGAACLQLLGLEEQAMAALYEQSAEILHSED